MSSEYILENCNKILKHTKRDDISELRYTDRTKYVQNMCRKFEEFFEKYPTLFYKIIENPFEFNMSRLENMLNMKRKIDDNKISHENASKKIGASYYNEFVKPYVGDKKE